MLTKLRKKLRQTSIATRLVLSFAAVIALLFAVAVQSNVSMRQADRIHRTNIEYILARRELAYRIQGEFNEFRFLLRDSYLSHSFLRVATRHDHRHYARLIGNSYDALMDFICEYIELAENDPIILYYRREAVINMGNETRDYISRIYYQFFNHFFPGSDHSEYVGNVREYMENVDAILGVMIDLTRVSADEALRETDTIINNSMNLTILLVFFALVLAALLAYLMTTSFTGRVHGIEDLMRRLQESDPDAVKSTKFNDEFSRIAANMIGVIKDRELASAKRMQTMFDATPIMIEFWDRNDNCIDCNHAVVEFYGAKSKEILLKDYNEHVDKNQLSGEPHWAGWREQIEITFEKGKHRFEGTNRNADGTLLHFEVFAQRIYMDGEDVVVTHTQDVTAKIEIETERKRSALAEENSLAKSRFLARMSHEIRTPLTAVLGISEIQLQNPTISLVVEEAFAKIYNSANILLSLVNDILDLSRIESGKMSIADKPYEVASMVIDVVQMHLTYLGSKKIDFKVNTDENLPAFLIGDELRVRQILNNLLSNAFKYTDSGEVELSLHRLENDDDGKITLQIRIRDTGHGMRPEHLQFLMEDYTRFHEKELRLVDGTGLGMPIVYSLLQLMGGKMDIESEVGVGTSVLILLPQGIEGEQIIGAETAENLKNIDSLSGSFVKRVKFIPEPIPYGKVLVVDDIDTNLYVARGLLMFYDLQIDTCTGGREAIELIKAGNTYDIIFMDQMMPEMNGTQATDELRKMGYTRPIIALTANALIGQAEAFLANGFDGFLSKPIQTVHLNAILTKHIRDNQPPEVVAAAIAQAQQFNGINSFVEREMSKLKKDFYNGQKNASKNIRGALETEDFETAHRLTHTLKGLAGIIKESDLANLAYKIEKKLRDKRIPGDEELSALEKKLNETLAEIEGTIENEETPAISIPPEELAALLDNLQKMLEDNNAASLSLAGKLSQIPETKLLVKLIEDYNFKTAQLQLKIMRDVLEI